MASTRSSPARRSRTPFQIQKPRGQITARVQAVGPEHFGILSVDCAKARSVMMLCDFSGTVLLPPQTVTHTHGDLHAAVDRLRQALACHQLHDHLVAIERTGEYHRPVQRAFRDAGSEVRLVHPLVSKQFRQPADPDHKTDATDLAGIFRAAVNGFGLLEAPWPPEYEQLQIWIRHRRRLVQKTTQLQCQIREYLHAAMPGYAECFDDLWCRNIALLIARHTGSAPAVRQAGLAGLSQWLTQDHRRWQARTLALVLAWADTAPPAHPHSACLRQVLTDLDDDRLAKHQQIQARERTSASAVVRTPYVRLLWIPGINLVSTGNLAGEMGPITHYANANAITGRAGLVPSRYQSDQVDRADGRLVPRANRRLRTALLQIADNLVAGHHHFQARARLWKNADKDPRWIRVKVAKTFSRLAFAIVAGAHPLRHPCRQAPHALLDKILAFHRQHDTDVTTLRADVQAAVDQLPTATYATEAQPLAAQWEKIQATRRGPQVLGDILAIVLARLGIHALESTTRTQDPS